MSLTNVIYVLESTDCWNKSVSKECKLYVRKADDVGKTASCQTGQVPQ